MNYLSIKETAKLWNISERRIRMLCSQGRVPGAVRLGNYMWNIPEGTDKPSDFRTIRYLQAKKPKIGAQDYSTASFLDEIELPTSDEKISIIKNILRYQNIFLTNKDISKIIFYTDNIDNSDNADNFINASKSASSSKKSSVKNLNNKLNPSISFSLSVKILDLYGSLSSLPIYINIQTLTDLNKSICRNLYVEGSGECTDSSKLDMLIQMYKTDWTILHPVARATFIFENILRNDLYKFNNTETAFLVLENELILNKLKCAVFPDSSIDELKGDLVSSTFRGNLQKVVSLLINSIS